MEGGLLSIQHRNKEAKVKATKKRAPFHYKLKHKNFKTQGVGACS